MIRRAVAAALAMLALTAAASAAHRAPRVVSFPLLAGWSPDGRWLSYYPCPQCARGLALVRRDGKVRRQLPVGDVSWAPDGKTLAIVERNGQLVLRRPGARAGAVVTDGVTGADWSPDGRSLLLLRDTPGQKATRMVIRDIASGAEREIPVDLGGCSDVPDCAAGIEPALWSPDGRMILFAIGFFEPAVYHGPSFAVRVMNADGTDEHAVGGLYECDDGPLLWSPDSSRIALVPNDTPCIDPGSTVVTIGAEGTGAREVAQVDDPDVLAYAWAPHGAVLAVLDGGDGALHERATLLVVGPRGKQLASVPGVRVGYLDESFSWSPDGRALAIAKRRAIVAYTLATKRSRTLVADGSHPRWSPTGTDLAYERDVCEPGGGIHLRDLRTGADRLLAPARC